MERDRTGRKHLRRNPFPAVPAFDAVEGLRTPAQRLEDWFQAHGRDLPWRRRHDPYEVLLAEFILQQTRMETGIRYYERLRRTFPTIEALARAPLSRLMAAWSGLGYYARGRNLHAAALEIVEKHDGKIPSDPEILQTLPGIGPYTAGAIASIAFDRPEPALDGNQLRVLGRFLGTRAPTSTAGRRRIEGWSRTWLATGSPRLLNQAVMDLGSSVCLPRRPRCERCPLAYECRYANRAHHPRLRQRRSAAKGPTQRWNALLFRRGDALWLVPPRKAGLLAGLWLPPMRPAVPGIVAADLVHRFSHRTWQVCLVNARGPPPRPGRWVRMTELERLPHSRLTARVMRAALGRGGAARTTAGVASGSR